MVGFEACTFFASGSPWFVDLTVAALSRARTALFDLPYSSIFALLISLFCKGPWDLSHERGYTKKSPVCFD